MTPEQVDKCSIMMMRAGSYAYGTQVPQKEVPSTLDLPPSDEDIRGVCIPTDMRYYMGTGVLAFEQKNSWPDGADKVVYDFRKAMKLIAQGNPNMLDLVFCDEEDYLFKTEYWDRVLEHRDLFITQQLRYKYGGYARSQMQKLKNRTVNGTFKWKHAMHLLRLMRMAKEILETGEINVRRPDAHELLEVRAGLRPLEDIIQEAEALDAVLDDIVSASPLPKKPNVVKIDHLCTNIVLDYLSENS